MGGWAKQVRGFRGTNSSSYRIKKSWGCNIQNIGYSQYGYNFFLILFYF